QVRVLRPLRAGLDDAGDADAVLAAQVVRPLGDLALAEHDLRQAGTVAEVDEDDAAMVTAAGHPSGEGDGLSGLVGAELAGEMRTQHYWFLPKDQRGLKVCGRRHAGARRWQSTRTPGLGFSRGGGKRPGFRAPPPEAPLHL